MWVSTERFGLATSNFFLISGFLIDGAARSSSKGVSVFWFRNLFYVYIASVVISQSGRYRSTCSLGGGGVLKGCERGEGSAFCHGGQHGLGEVKVGTVTCD